MSTCYFNLSAVGWAQDRQCSRQEDTDQMPQLQGLLDSHPHPLPPPDQPLALASPRWAALGSQG